MNTHESPNLSKIRATKAVEPCAQISTSGGECLEAPQVMHNELGEEPDTYFDHVFCGIPVRTALVAYLVMTIVILIYESTYIILYFVGVIPDSHLIAANSPGISEGLRAYYMDLEEKQQPWLIAQLTWYGFGILFSLFGFVAFFTRSLTLLKVFQTWLFAHVFAYFTGAFIFDQVSPIVLEVPGYVMLTMVFAITNVYAAYLSTIYHKKLVAIDVNDQKFANIPGIKNISSPV